MSALKDFVTSILRKRSKPVEEGRDERLAKTLQLVKEQIMQAPGSSRIKIARAEIAEIVLPKVVHYVSKEGHTVTDFEKAQDYALAMAHVIGLIAALTLQEDVLDGAIEECFDYAKKGAHFVRGELKKRGKFTKPDGSPDGPTSNSSNTDSGRTQRMSMIQDLELQATKETDLVYAATLRAMAERMRKELNGEVKEHVA